MRTDLYQHPDYLLMDELLTDEQIRERLSQIRERDIDEGTFEEVV